MTAIQKTEEKLRRMILDMEIGPGERLTERWIEGQVGTSRSSIRTALFRLEAEGLIRREGRSWIVSPININEIEQLFVYREILEIAAIRLGGHIITESNFIKIEKILSALTSESTPEQSEQIGYEFHLWIANLSNNDFIIQGIQDAMLQLQRVRWLESDSAHHGWEEHHSIINALRQDEVESAVDLLEKHIRTTKERLLTILEKDQRSLRAKGITIVSN
ncbi:GntR family transcriptional regulator [Providencia stuartii]|uniref:GntR family transcriptional regulator n=1 Tax=Providencia stuartii TaxID=588 RepID=A0AAJ1JFT8_PROST|nr:MULTISPECIES: GntR family transcriptional regulator [Providencia]EMA3640188.1 GntR family transcriptional regulator [Providencia stuartii]MBW3100568.1 GntR family transcriptional regulator [Providencia stuartii]MCB5216117.1 GntR family transcriptional regulator [Providencia stuartii]MDE5308124.1 GntR family transcriptional regulator [Providencia stuartii]MDE8750544.1 GntR family transcriptional regulator [Providencia thailandensis]